MRKFIYLLLPLLLVLGCRNTDTTSKAYSPALQNFASGAGIPQGVFTESVTIGTGVDAVTLTASLGGVVSDATNTAAAFVALNSIQLGSSNITSWGQIAPLTNAAWSGFTTTTNLSYLNGNLQNFTVSAVTAFSLTDPVNAETNKTISFRLNLIGSNTVTFPVKISGAANLTVTNSTSSFMFDWTAKGTNWFGYKLR